MLVPNYTDLVSEKLMAFMKESNMIAPPNWEAGREFAEGEF